MFIGTIQKIKTYTTNLLVTYFNKTFPKEENQTRDIIGFVVLIIALFLQIDDKGSYALQAIKGILLLTFFGINFCFLLGFIEHCNKRFNGVESSGAPPKDFLYGLVCFSNVLIYSVFIIAILFFAIEQFGFPISIILRILITTGKLGS